MLPCQVSDFCAFLHYVDLDTFLLGWFSIQSRIWKEWLPKFLYVLERSNLVCIVEVLLKMKMQKLKLQSQMSSVYVLFCHWKTNMYYYFLHRFAQRAKCTYSSIWAYKHVRLRQPTPFISTRWRGHIYTSTWKTGECDCSHSKPPFRICLGQGTPGM